MGLFRAINRKVETDYMYGEVFKQLSILLESGSYPCLRLQVAGVDCHLGRGGRHITFFVDYGNELLSLCAAFHLCRTKGYVRNSDEGQWVEAEWFYMAPSAQLIASRIIAYCDELQAMLETLQEVAVSTYEEQTKQKSAKKSANSNPAPYDKIVQKLSKSKLKDYEMKVVMGLEGIPNGKGIEVTLPNNNKTLIFSKRNNSTSFDGRWNAFVKDLEMENPVSETLFSLTVAKTLSESQQKSKFVDSALEELDKWDFYVPYLNFEAFDDTYHQEETFDSSNLEPSYSELLEQTASRQIASIATHLWDDHEYLAELIDLPCHKQTTKLHKTIAVRLPQMAGVYFLQLCAGTAVASYTGEGFENPADIPIIEFQFPENSSAKHQAQVVAEFLDGLISATS